MEFVCGFPSTLHGFDSILVIVDRLTKSANFIPVRVSYSTDRLDHVFIQEVVHTRVHYFKPRLTVHF